jgi:hypothetical protein
MVLGSKCRSSILKRGLISTLQGTLLYEGRQRPRRRRGSRPYMDMRMAPGDDGGDRGEEEAADDDDAAQMRG